MLDNKTIIYLVKNDRCLSLLQKIIFSEIIKILLIKLKFLQYHPPDAIEVDILRWEFFYAKLSLTS